MLPLYAVKFNVTENDNIKLTLSLINAFNLG